MPLLFTPSPESPDGTPQGPLTGRVVKVHRMPGHFVGKGDPVVDVQLGVHLVTLCAPEAGKLMKCRDVGAIVKGNDHMAEVTSVGTPTWELFVAYRRADAPGHAGRVGDYLRAYFGPGQMFKDVDSLPLGVDFVDFIREKLQRAFVMIVVIGPNWLIDRLQDPEDLHREEIRTAIARGVQIFPALVNGATMPPKEVLPEDIRALTRRNAVEITDTRWDYDTGRLIEKVAEALAESPRRRRFLAQVPPWDYKGGGQWVADDPPEGDEPMKYE